jgi:thiamine-phosphate pyrophosphorylase
LHVIVNPTAEERQLELAEAVLGAGAPLLQIRVKGASDRQRLALVAPLVELCHGHDALALVNDRADVCLATGADGVHGGADDLPVAALRRVVGADRLVGGTGRDPERARELEGEGVDYLGVGPAYATTSKAGLPDAIGPEMIAKVAGAVEVPVIAIGGVTVDRVAELRAAGAHGVAVIGAIASAPDPAVATRRFLDALGVS